jgi:ABC-type uncharacterized transport system ATPase subunit
VSLIRDDDRLAEIEFKRTEETAATVTRHLLGHYPVRDLRISEPSIEDVVKSLYLDRSSAIGAGESIRD